MLNENQLQTSLISLNNNIIALQENIEKIKIMDDSHNEFLETNCKNMQEVLIPILNQYYKTMFQLLEEINQKNRI